MKHLFYSFLFLGFVGQAMGQCFDPGMEIWSDTWRSCQNAPNPNPLRDDGHWIMYDFGEVYRLSKTHVWNTNETGLSEMGFRNVIVDYSVDGQTWEELGTYEFPQGTEEAIYPGFEGFDFTDSLAQFVLITAVDNWGHPSCYGISEVKFNLREPGDFAPAELECEAPEQAESFVLSHDIVLIFFEENPLATEYTFLYRPEGGDWDEGNVENGEVILFNLQPETTYEYQILVECSDGSSYMSEIFTFTTIPVQQGCGVPLTTDYYVLNQIDDIYFAIITCNYVPNATSYRMRFRIADNGGAWTEMENTDPFFEIGFLQEGVEYEYQFSVLCPFGWTEYSDSYYFSTEEPSGSYAIRLGATNFELFPNPASDFVNLKISSMETSQVEILITNMMGQMLYRMPYRLTMGPNTVTVPLNQIGAGIYFVSLVQDQKGVASQRLVVVD